MFIRHSHPPDVRPLRRSACDKVLAGAWQGEERVLKVRGYVKLGTG